VVGGNTMFSFTYESIYFEITAFCNRNCPYCYNDSNAFGDYLQKEVIFEMLNECKHNHIKHITISGGEPFCHPDIHDIIDRMNELRITGTFISNLTLLTSDKIEELLKSGHSIQVTLDSVDEEKNDITRGKGSYKSVVNLLSVARRCNKLNKVALRFNLSKENVDELEQMVNLAVDNGMRLLNFALLTKSGRASTFGGVYDYNTDIVELAQLMKQMKLLSLKYKEIIKIQYSDLKEQVGCALYSDGEIKLSPKIDPEGNVYLCQLFTGSENVIGSIKADSLSNILKAPRAIDVAKRIRKRKKKQTECPNCSFSDFCMCGCPAVSYNQTGSIYEKNDQCGMIKFFMKEKIKQIGDQNDNKGDYRTE